MRITRNVLSDSLSRTMYVKVLWKVSRLRGHSSKALPQTVRAVITANSNGYRSEHEGISQGDHKVEP